jgi:hypothetical protein
VTLETTRTISLTRGAFTLAWLMRDRRISDRNVAAFLGVSHVTVLSWRQGEKTPELPNQARLELLFAKTNDVGDLIFRGGRIESDLPRGFWAQPATEAA